MTTEPHFCPPHQRKYVLMSAILASAMGFIDFSIIAVALPQIRSVLGADFAQAQWVSNAYMLFLSALILLGGALGDRFGLKTVFSFGIALFTFASLACAISWNVESLIAFRALQGAGAAIMIPGSMAIISINTPRAERGKALGIWVAASSITTSLGPLLGGILLTYGGEFGWRWIFAINLPFGALALVVLWRLVPRDTPKHQGRLSSIDWTGAVLLTASLAMIAVGLTYLGELDEGAWAMTLLLAGLILAVLAVTWELKHRDPLVSMQLFANTAFAGANLLTLLVWSGVGAVVFFLPMLMIIAWKLPATYAGAMFLPFSLMIALLSPLSGRLVDRYGIRRFLTGGPVIIGFAFLALAWAVIHQDYWLGVLPATMLVGVGLGLSASPLSTAIMNAVDDKHSGAASGINNMIARMANLFGVAGMGAFVSFVYAKVVQGGDLDPSLARLMVEAGFGERLTGALYQIRTEELQVVAMNHAFIALCGVLAIMCFCAAIVGWLSQPAADH
ncbi:MAG: MFS transporter [Rhizobiaceae bacterium]